MDWYGHQGRYKQLLDSLGNISDHTEYGTDTVNPYHDIRINFLHFSKKCDLRKLDMFGWKIYNALW